MKATPPIVVGIDFSDSSPILLRHAIHAAEAGGATLVALHVLDQGLREHRQLTDPQSPEFKALVTIAQERFAKLVPASAHRQTVELIVRAGKPADELVGLAQELGASFLIVSANDMTKKRLGSVAARCVRTASCDVLILRDWQGGDFKNVAVFTDFSATAEKALRLAGSIAQRTGARLGVIHVMYPPEMDDWGKALDHLANSPLSYEEECRTAAEAQMDRLLEQNADVLKGVAVEPTILESAAPSIAMTSHVRHSGADLVVLGTHGNSGFTSRFIGTNAERLIQDAPVSVFAVRKPVL